MMDYMAATREEVERELERKMASISGSISRIRKDLSLPTEPVKTAVREHPVQVLLGAVAAGLVMGWIVKGTRRRSKKASKSAAKASNPGTAQFVHVLQAARAAGLSEEEALARALAVTTGPVASGTRRGLTDRLLDHVVDMADALVKTALRVAAKEAAAWVAESVRKDKPPSSQ